MRSLSYTVDARGLNCPEPVILTKRRVDQGDEHIVVLVSNPAAKENVSRLGANQGYEVTIEEQGDDFEITLRKSALIKNVAKPLEEVAILVKSDLFGQGDEELGQILMKSFLYTLNETAGIRYIIFMNRAVYLTTEGSPVLEYLKSLEEKGISILSCGTCLDFYQKKQQLAVGAVTNMYTAMEILTRSARNLTI